MSTAAEREALFDAALAVGGDGPAPAATGKDGGDGGGGQEDPEPDDSSEEEDKPVSQKAFKSRINKLIGQRDEARAEGVETRSLLQQMREEQARQTAKLREMEERLMAGRAPVADDDDDDDDPTAKALKGVRAEVQALRKDREQDREQAERQRRLAEQAHSLRRDIEGAVKTFPKSSLDEVVREMRLDHRLTPVEAARIVHKREEEKEKAILARYAGEKGKKADATRRAPEASAANPLGTDVVPAPPKPTVLTAEERRRKIDEAAAKHNVFHR